jgi:hypothetical protein
LVVVGDLVGAGEAQERGIVGETPNLAARLQGLAEPNSVVIAESTRKLLGDLFELGDSAQKTSGASWGFCVPGRRCARVAWKARFEALHASGLTDLVGRDAEANGRNNLAMPHSINASDSRSVGAGGMASKIRRVSYDDRGGLLNSH